MRLFWIVLLSSENCSSGGIAKPLKGSAVIKGQLAGTSMFTRHATSAHVSWTQLSNQTPGKEGRTFILPEESKTSQQGKAYYNESSVKQPTGGACLVCWKQSLPHAGFATQGSRA